MKVYNFSAGPSTLPQPVLEKVQKEFLNFRNSGMSVVEISHRAKLFMEVVDELTASFKEVLNIPDNYKVIFVQGGASTQFEAVPLNLLVKGKADYLVTGNFAKKAYKEAMKYGDISCAASSEDKTFTYIPREYNIREDIDYVHICHNNTIFGTRYTFVPDTKGALLVADMSSSILSQEIDVAKYGVIYAGAQKNVAPAGVTIVIVREDLLERSMDICPTMLKWKTQVDNDSLYNTPPCFSMYVANLVMDWIKEMGGVKEMQKINEYKAGLLYDFIDNSSFYTNSVNVADRSMMNVPFVSPNKDLDAAFVKEAEANGLTALKGHRLVGGMRASIYNAMPVEGVKTLIDFMKKFEQANK